MKTKILFIVTLLTIVLSNVNSQTTVNKKKYKIVVQMTTADSTAQRSTVRQINNALVAAPNSTIEVVCHSGGISFLQISKSTLQSQIKELKSKGVTFAACANSMREHKIDKSDLVPEAFIVPAGIIEVVDKESLGWSYLKAGN